MSDHPISSLKIEIYTQVISDIEIMIETESDWIAILATVACELHQDRKSVV